MAQNALRDENRIPVMLFVGSDGGTYYAKGDEITGRLYVDLNGDAGDVNGPASSVNENIAVFDGITGKIIKDGAKKISELQLALGYTAENVANKSTNVATDGASDTKYPSVKAVKDYADGLVVGLWDDRGSYDASGNVYPSTGGSGTAGAILKGDIWTISVAGTLGGVSVDVGDTVRALTDTPGQTSTNWSVLENNIGYVPENVANKKTDLSDNSDNYYPSQKAVKTAVDAKVDKSLFGANTILYASTDDTPVALTIPEQTIVGRKTGGNIEALAIDSDLSSVSANDDTVPSAKATKTALDLKAPSASPTFTGTVTLPKTLEIQDTSADHQYVLAVNELTADRTITLPLLTGNDEFVFKDHTQTLTNKRVTKRVASTTDDATAVIDCDSYDEYYLTAIANNTEISITGTPTAGQTIFIGLKDAGATKTLTWTGITALVGTLPTATTSGKQHIIGLKYIASAWRSIAVGVEA